MLRPAWRACARTRPASPRRQLDREHHRVLRHLGPPRPGRALGITAGLPHRAPEPARQHPGRLGHRHARLHQVSGSIDPRGVLARTNPVASHAVIVLPYMASPGRGAPRPHITAPRARDRSIHDAIVSAVAVSSPASHPATRRSQAPSSTPPRTLARITDRSASGTNPPGADSSGPDDTSGRAAVTGHAPAAGNPASPRNRSCQLCWGREDSALGSSGQCLFPASEVGEDPGFQERLHQGADTLILDPHPQPAHQS